MDFRMSAGRRLVLSLICVCLVGCECGPQQIPCATDEDCPEGEACDVDGTGLCYTPDASVDSGTVDAGCATACASYQVCVAPSCLSLYTDVEIGTPAPNSFVGPSVEIGLTLDVVTGFDRNDPAALSFTATPLTGPVETESIPLLGDGTYEATWMPAQQTTYTLVAAYPDAGLTSTPVTVVVLLTPPSFSAVVPPSPRDGGIGTDPAPGYAQAWRRDELFTVGVTSADTYVDLSTVEVVVVGIGGLDGGVAGPVIPVTGATGCGQPFCSTALIDLSLPPFEAFRGMIRLDVIGQDYAGNAGTSSTLVPLTRWKWSEPLGGPIATNLAVGHTGNIYVGTGGAAPQLLDVGPDGTVHWALDGGIQTGVAVGGRPDAGDVVYAAIPFDGGAALVALDGTSGSQLQACPVATGVATGGIALLPTTILGQSLETAVALFDDPASPQLMALRRGASAASACETSPMPPLVVAGGSLVTDGVSQVFYADDAGNVDGYLFDSGWPGAPSWSTGPFGARGIALWSGDVIGGGSPTPSGVFALPFGAQSLGWSYSDGGSAQVWATVVGDGGVIYAGDQSGAFSATLIGGTTPSTASTTAGALVASPVLGQGGFVYTVDQAGNVVTWDTGLTQHWSFAPAAAPATLNLDCARDSSGNLLPRPGVLLIASNTGTLYAIVVDSVGIDNLAPWPMAQHDPRHSGSAGTNLSEFICY
jgi:hypothetical protein